MKTSFTIQAHPFHLVEPSPWPLAASFSLLLLTSAAVMNFHGTANGGILLILGFICVLTSMALWWRDCVREGTYQGNHTSIVQRGITIGFILFVISEVFFFLSIFWAFFHSALSPSIELGAVWPPKGVMALNPFELPLLNTVILLSSGATLTWGHHSMIAGDRKGALFGIFWTIFLAIIFTACQAFEYYNAPFTIADSVYGSCFYFSTGFHGLHVIIGTIFLVVSFYRIISYQLTDSHHVGFESAILYWHFVDVVWLFLYVSVYYWGS